MSHSFLYLMALGDSYGMKYEFVEHAQDKTQDDLFHGTHPKFLEYQKGRYTDDTQMSLANLELLLAKQRQGAVSAISEDELISSWLRAFRRDPHEGYSRYMYKVMSEAQTPQDFRSMIDASRGVTSGAAMRAAPFGLLLDVEEVKRLTELQARLTHATPAGVNAALAVALTTHFLHHGGTRERVSGFLIHHLGAEWNSTASGYDEDPNNGLKIVSQALSSLLQASTLSDVLLRVVNQDRLSDTDTVAAIAMVMAARATDLAHDLPNQLKEGLEQGAFGAAYLQEMDAQAVRVFPRSLLYEVKGPVHHKGFMPQF